MWKICPHAICFACLTLCQSQAADLQEADVIDIVAAVSSAPDARDQRIAELERQLAERDQLLEELERKLLESKNRKPAASKAKTRTAWKAEWVWCAPCNEWQLQWTKQDVPDEAVKQIPAGYYTDPDSGRKYYWDGTKSQWVDQSSFTEPRKTGRGAKSGSSHLIAATVHGAASSQGQRRASSTVSSDSLASSSEAANTPREEVIRILSLLPIKADQTFMEFGCGADARWAIEAAKRYGCDAIAIEIDEQRAKQARWVVAEAGLLGKVQVVHGDATELDIEADVGVAYLYPDTLAELVPKIKQLKAFASYKHPVSGLRLTKDGDAYLWKAEQRQARQYRQPVNAAVWQGQYYYGRVCDDSSCAMCASIQRQLSRK